MAGMQTFVMGIICLAVALIVGIFILGMIPSAAEAGSLAYNTTTNYSNIAIAALGNGVPWITILVVVGFAVITIGMLTSGFGRHNGARGAPAY